MIQIDKATMAKLHRYAATNALAEKLINQGDEVGGCELYDDEFRRLQSELVQEFLPLMQKLVRAGLIVVGIDGDGDFISGDAVTVFENGTLCLHAAEISMLGDQPLLQDDDRPEEGCHDPEYE